MRLRAQVQPVPPHGGSWREHGLQGPQRCSQGPGPQRGHSLDQARSIESSNLIQKNQTLLALEGERDAEARRPRSCRHGCHDDCTKVRVHFVRRNHDAGPRLLHLAAHRRVELGQPDVTRLHHQTSSSSPSLANSGQTRTSSPCSASNCVRLVPALDLIVRFAGLRSHSGHRLRAPSPRPRSANRHSNTAFDNHRGVPRGFLPRGLSDTCPQDGAGRSVAACAGRCPTTLNKGRR